MKKKIHSMSDTSEERIRHSMGGAEILNGGLEDLTEKMTIEQT